MPRNTSKQRRTKRISVDDSGKVTQRTEMNVEKFRPRNTRIMGKGTKKVTRSPNKMSGRKVKVRPGEFERALKKFKNMTRKEL